MIESFSIHFAPLIPWSFLWVFTGFSAALIIISGLKARHLLIWRTVTAILFLSFLSGPSLVEEQREPVKDIAALILDESASQKMGEREDESERLLEALSQNLKSNENLDLRVIRTSQNDDDPLQTNLFESLETALSDVPQSRRAGAIFITDGQVHDYPKNEEFLTKFGPLHTILTGDKNEKDRHIKIISAPAYGLVGEKIDVTFRIEQSGKTSTAITIAKINWNGQDIENKRISINQNHTISLPIENAGQNILQITTDADQRELTEVNNKIALSVNGVRDRLKVLLVSGQPHNGGRTWRDMLTSDPGVDLVHFTILREPDKIDTTPQRDLSLIAFPFRELFEIKLYDFDLIIFDRYKLNRILPTYYFSNIARYVREGGALLVSSGPSFADDSSLYNTELKDIFPGIPTGEVYNRAFKPALTKIGLNHPVTMDFAAQQDSWGSWLRQISMLPDAGDTVMSGLDNRPLMILNRVGEGRVAQIASDQIWLWSRGYDGGGPHRDLLRRTAHWLMKEPELDESALQTRISKGTLTVTKRSLTDNEQTVTIKTPTGEDIDLSLSRNSDIGVLSGKAAITDYGVYSITDGTQNHAAIYGDLNTKEMNAVIATDTIMSKAADISGGSVKWISDKKAPAVRMVGTGRKYAGAGWIGLRANNDYTVHGLKERPLFPIWIALILLSLSAVWMWWREGKRS